MSLDGGRRPEYPEEYLERTNADKGRTCKPPTCRLKHLMVDLNPGPSCCEATVLLLSVRLKTNHEFCLDICKSTKDGLHLLCNTSGQNHSQFGLLCLIITVPSGNDKANPKSIISIIQIPEELQLSLICNVVQETNFYFWIKRCLK